MYKKSLIHNWKNKHKLLYGFPHSTVKFWDLRYFNDQNVLIKNINSYPCLIQYCAMVLMLSYKISRISKKRLIKVESLRYLYLKNLRPKK